MLLAQAARENLLWVVLVRKSWSRWSACWRADSAPYQLQHSREQALVAEVRVSWPQGLSMGKLSLALICHAVVWAWERCTHPYIPQSYPASDLAICGRWVKMSMGELAPLLAWTKQDG